jgi:hypothetical protein
MPVARMPMRGTGTSTIVEQAPGRRRGLTLRAIRDHYEMISNGVSLMDTRSGESERLCCKPCSEVQERDCRTGAGVTPPRAPS